MQQKVHYHFGGIIPTKILEVQKDYPAIGLPQGVVEAEIRRAERALAPVQLLAEGHARCFQMGVTPVDRAFEQRPKLAVKKLAQGLVSGAIPFGPTETFKALPQV